MSRESDKGRLGGAWIAAAVGLSEYASPLDAYLRVTGEVVDERSGEAIDRGNFLEPALREWHREKLVRTQPIQGAPVRILRPETQRHREFPWASYTPDGLVQMDAPRISETNSGLGSTQFLAEYKAPGDDSARRYGEPGTDQVPRDVSVQVRWGLFVTDLPKADVAALIGGELRLFHVEREPDLEREIFDRARFFMEEYVEKKRPPPPTFSERDTEWVKKRFPKHDPGRQLQWTQLTAEQRALVDRYIHSYLAHDELKKKLQALENAVKLDVFGDATSLAGDEGAPFKRIDWKNNETAGPAWKKVAEDFKLAIAAAVAMQVGSDRAIEMVSKLWDELVKEHAPETPPRVFRPWFARGQK